MLILLLAAALGRLFPVGGYGNGVRAHFYSMFLPALTVALGISPILIRSLRASLLNVLESDYITTARSKGISERRVIIRHALRNGDHLDGHRARHQPRPSWSATPSSSRRCSRCPGIGS